LILLLTISGEALQDLRSEVPRARPRCEHEAQHGAAEEERAQSEQLRVPVPLVEGIGFEDVLTLAQQVARYVREQVHGLDLRGSKLREHLHEHAMQVGHRQIQALPVLLWGLGRLERHIEHVLAEALEVGFGLRGERRGMCFCASVFFTVVILGHFNIQILL
jgi:hypothetical protein